MRYKIEDHRFGDLDREILLRAAAYLETEGNINVNRILHKNGKYQYVMRCQIRNTNLVFIKWLETHFYGYVGASRPIGNRKLCYSWCIRGNHAEQFLVAIRPFMIIKLEQVEVALEMQSVIHAYGARMPADHAFLVIEPFYQRMKELNKVGA